MADQSDHGPKPSILIVDDEHDILFILKDILSDHYQVISAATQEQAIQSLKHNKIDIILTDVQLPNTQNLEILDRYREINKTVPIIVISGSFGRQIQKASFEKGVQKYITKPFNETELLSAVEECLKKSA